MRQAWWVVKQVDGLASLPDLGEAKRGRRTFEVVSLLCCRDDVARCQKLFHLLDGVFGLLAPCSNESPAELFGLIAVIERQDLAESIHINYTIEHVYLARLADSAWTAGMMVLIRLSGACTAGVSGGHR